MLKQVPVVLVATTIVVNTGAITPVYASGTNCWGLPLIKHRMDRVLVSSDRCDKPIFYLTRGERTRNIRSSPNGRIIGKMNEVGDYSLFESTLIGTYDNGKTYWAFGEAFSESNPRKRIKGWIEVGNTKAILQKDRPGSNDVWYKF
ncbi:hypothetical protein IQ250_00480 [Pseudanabaenaceae cyanobacterium LEGE 13415]|nr:hypothetical protein [Pseudanabaenaceae cyanobacterium LEGE 13415]